MDKRYVWEKICGTKSTCYDYSGRKMIYADFQNRNSLHGWDVELIKPLELGGHKRICNLQVASLKTIDERCEAYPKWTVNGRSFNVIETINDGYKVEEIK